MSNALLHSDSIVINAFSISLLFSDCSFRRAVISLWRCCNWECLRLRKAQDMLPVDDVEEILGKGVKIKSVTIEIVNEPVTWGG